MSPHLIVLALAFSIGAVARAVRRETSPLLIVAGAVLVTVCGLGLYAGALPSLLGMALTSLGSAVGATAGVLATSGLLWVMRRS